MCGICGFNRASKSSIPNGRKFATASLLAIESRGRDATGAAWFEKGDDDYVYYDKAQGPATRIAPKLAMPAKGITTLVGHTRYLTLGTALDNDNNHPVVHGRITAVHNGRVENHDELVELAGVPRVGKVDSFAFAALLSQQDRLGADHPKELLELVHGVAAIAWLDGSDPGVLHLARLSTRPLAVGWTKRGDLVFASTQSALRRTAVTAGVGITDIIDIPEGTYLRVRDGAFEEWSTFKVNHPKVKQLDFDMPKGMARPARQDKPKGKKGKRRPTVSSYDPDKDPVVMSHNEYLARLDGFEAWEDQVDWDSLVPRRGWDNWPARELAARSGDVEPDDDTLFG
jgi:glucosamine 6-phosphate synthetase-like amidotransferase/phosphosugar isomerase protein